MLDPGQFTAYIQILWDVNHQRARKSSQKREKKKFKKGKEKNVLI